MDGRRIEGRINSLAVFCGARFGADGAHADAARTLGAGLARAGIRLVYGCGRVGLMGVVADAVLAGGGTVVGVIPDFMLRWEVGHPGATEMIVVDTMHARKLRMFREADAFLALPGGIGTLDELIEVVSWRQLRRHDKPILVCDVGGYWKPLEALLEATVAAGFAGAETRRLYEFVNGPEAALARLAELPPGSGGGADGL
jgi:uncharacterized protein (TIGR00730 family)